MIRNTKMLYFPMYNDKYGKLVPVEANGNVPFDVKRVYYIYEVMDGMRRGFHSHRDLQQALICIHGSVKILVKTPFEEDVVCLNNPQEALWIGPMVWREMYDFENDGVLLVLASEHYTEDDYIRDYQSYEQEAKVFFNVKEKRTYK